MFAHLGDWNILLLCRLIVYVLVVLLLLLGIGFVFMLLLLVVVIFPKTIARGTSDK